MNSVPLAEVAEINPPGPKASTLEPTERLDFVPMAAVGEDGRMVIEEQRRFSEVAKGYTAFRNHDVLLAKITPCFENNKIALAEIRTPYAFGSTEFHVLRCAQDKLDPKYLTYYLRQDRIRRAGERRMTGSAGQRRVPKIFLEELEIPLPPLEEQKRIAEILDQADNLRRLRQRAIDRLNTLGQAIFYEMFGDPASNPKNWKSVNLGDLIVYGPQNGLYKHSSSYGEGTPILRIDAFYDGGVTKLDQLKRLSASKGEIDTYGLAPGDIVINRVNSVEYLGKSAIIPELFEPTVFESNMMRLRVDEKAILPAYLIALLQTPFIKDQIRQRTKDAVNQSSINQKDVNSFVVRVPPMGVQQHFVSEVAAVDLLKPIAHAALKYSASLFASLQHRAFRGEL